MSNPKCWCQAKKYRTSSNFGPIFHARMQEFLGVFYHVKKLLQNTLFWRGFLAFFYKKWPFYKSFFGCFYHVKKLVQNTMFWRGFLHFLTKKNYRTHAKIPEFDDFGKCPVFFFGVKFYRTRASTADTTFLELPISPTFKFLS